MGYYLKTFLGGGLFIGSVVLFNVQLLALLETGTCASGGPYVVARECPEGTGTDVLLLVGSIFGGMIGAGLVGTRGQRPGADRPSSGSGAYLMWSLFFTVTGAVVGYASLTDDTFGEDAKLGGIIVGATFLIMGLPVLLFVFWATFSNWRNRPPDDRFQPSYAQAQPAASPTSPAMAPTGWPLAGAGSQPSPVPAVESPDPELAQLEQLERLQKLREAGALTDTEFEQQKRRILDN